MAASVATPLERQFSAIAGLDSINSTSSQGTTQVTLQFALDRNIDAAAQDVRRRSPRPRASFRRGCRRRRRSGRSTRPTSRSSTSSLSSPTLPLTAVDEYAETLIAQRLSTISGVAQVVGHGRAEVRGARARSTRRSSRRAGSASTRSRRPSSGRTRTCPSGRSTASTSRSPCRRTVSSSTPRRTAPMIVAYRNGSPVTLGDLGQVVDGVENDRIGELVRRRRRS